MRQAQPPRSTKKIAFITSRIGQHRCRPVSAGGGSNGASICHSASIRSLGYRRSSRSCSARVSAVHIEGSSNWGALRFHGFAEIQDPCRSFETASKLPNAVGVLPRDIPEEVVEASDDIGKPVEFSLGPVPSTFRWNGVNLLICQLNALRR